MRNTPKSLNEELMKMRKLMNFDISENSHDVLSENFVKKSTISEQGLSNYENDRAFTEKVLKVKSENKWRNIFIKDLGPPTPIQLKPDKVSATYYDNMVTMASSINPGELKKQLDDAIEGLLSTPGFDPTKVEMTVVGTANSKPPTTVALRRFANGLDHPDNQAFNGLDVSKKENHNAGNMYLAEKRAESIANYIKPNIEGMTITHSGRVEPGTGDDDKFILLGVKYKDDVQEPIINGLPKLEVTNDLQIKTGTELGVNNETNNAKQNATVYDPKTLYYMGTRTIKITPAQGPTPHVIIFEWVGIMGDNPFESSATAVGAGGSEQRLGSWTGVNKGRIKNATSDDYEKTQDLLKTSGFVKDDTQAAKLIEMLRNGGDENAKLIKGTITGFDTFINSMGGGTPSFDVELALTNGAILIDNINKKITL